MHMRNRILKECKADARRKASARRIINLMLHALYLLHGEVKRYSTYYYGTLWLIVDFKIEENFKVEARASGLEADCVCLLVRGYRLCSSIVVQLSSVIIIKPIVPALLATSTWLMPAALMFSWPHDSVGIHLHVLYRRSECGLPHTRKSQNLDTGRNQMHGPIFLQCKMLHDHLIYAKYEASPYYRLVTCQ